MKNFEYVIGIDPGTAKSAFTVLDMKTFTPIATWHGLNEDLVKEVCKVIPKTSKVIMSYERMQQYNIGAGESVFRSCMWYGRFIESMFNSFKHIEIYSVSSPLVKLCLLGLTNPPNAKTKVKRALYERFPQTGGGATPAIGTKTQPGMLYMFRGKEKNHCWDALAVLIVTLDFLNHKFTGDIQKEIR